mmetsp:Transcript_8646/g.39327  ORF Transcript_8646/g.39327 Transcript_8646/m.39327 type:complete len:229 (-) Transcript_8646:3275-3961(-)
MIAIIAVVAASPMTWTNARSVQLETFRQSGSMVQVYIKLHRARAREWMGERVAVIEFTHRRLRLMTSLLLLPIVLVLLFRYVNDDFRELALHPRGVAHVPHRHPRVRKHPRPHRLPSLHLDVALARFCDDRALSIRLDARVRRQWEGRELDVERLSFGALRFRGAHLPSHRAFPAPQPPLIPVLEKEAKEHEACAVYREHGDGESRVPSPAVVRRLRGIALCAAQSVA